MMERQSFDALIRRREDQPKQEGRTSILGRLLG